MPLPRRAFLCLQCRRLPACDKNLWKEFADFHAQMIKLQQEYVATTGLVPA